MINIMLPFIEIKDKLGLIYQGRRISTMMSLDDRSLVIEMSNYVTFEARVAKWVDVTIEAIDQI